MKKGLKKSAPDTPDPIATVEKRTAAGKIHHKPRKVSIIPHALLVSGKW